MCGPAIAFRAYTGLETATCAHVISFRVLGMLGNSNLRSCDYMYGLGLLDNCDFAFM